MVIAVASGAAKAQTSAELAAVNVPPHIEPERRPDSWGTGFVVDHQGHILTARHVVASCRRVEVWRDGVGHQAVATTLSDDDDLALIQVAEQAGNPLPFAAGGGGHSPLVTVLGYAPLSQIQRSQAGSSSVSSFNALVLDDASESSLTLASTAAPGGSGSPVLSDDGHVLGILVSKTVRYGAPAGDRVPSQVRHAIKASRAVAFLRAQGVQFLLASDRDDTPPDVVALLSESEVRVDCFEE